MPQARATVKMPERELQDAVIKLARLLGWRSAHFRPAMTTHGWRTAVQGDGKGFPDVVLIRDERLVVAELKSDSGQLTNEQDQWLAAWRSVGAEVHVWRPEDLQTIADILR